MSINMKNWDYDNEQWTQLPPHLKHLPLFTRHIDWMSYIIRYFWFIFLFLFFKTWVRLKVVGDFKKIYEENPRLLIISNHTSHLDANVITAAIPFRYSMTGQIFSANAASLSHSFDRLGGCRRS